MINILSIDLDEREAATLRDALNLAETNYRYSSLSKNPEHADRIRALYLRIDKAITTVSG